MPWWRPPLRRAIGWLLAVAFGVVVVVVAQTKLVEWFWMNEAGLLAHLKFLTLEIHLATVLLSWLGTLLALAFGMWIFELECRKQLRKTRDEAAVWLHSAWMQELVRHSAEAGTGQDSGEPMEEVLAKLYAEMEMEERHDDEQ